MATIPSDIRFIGISPDVDLTEKKSARLNAEQQPYTMQDIIDTTGGGGGSPAGTAGQIQFSDGSAFAADSNLYWDDTNKRLGVGTSSPSATAHFKGSGTTSATSSLMVANNADTTALEVLDDSRVKLGNSSDFTVYSGAGVVARFAMNIGSTSLPTAQLQVKGSGSTSATTSLLVQNSSGLTSINATDDGTVTVGTNSYIALRRTDSILIRSTSGYEVHIGSGATNYLSVTTTGTHIATGSGAAVASAQLQVDSTVRGFLPPRQLESQRTAIASPAVGLMVYQTDGTEGLYVYKSTGWTFVA